MSEKTYSKKFFTHQDTGSFESAGEIVPFVVGLLSPESVVDIGCGTGTWLSVLAEQGVTDFLGVDGEWINKGDLLIPEDKFLSHDLTQNLMIEREFDLVISLEVAEHLPEGKAEHLVSLLTNLGPMVLFSAAIPYQGGIKHVNEQWPSYWVELFENKGYQTVDMIRPRFWENNRINYYYAQNTFLFVKESTLASNAKLREIDKKFNLPLNLVHPKKFLSAATDYAPFERKSYRSI